MNDDIVFEILLDIALLEKEREEDLRNEEIERSLIEAQFKQGPNPIENQ